MPDTTKTTPREDHAHTVADRLIEQLRNGTAPWQKPWKPGQGPTLPYNAATGKPYRGGNTVWLAMQGRGDPRWMTFNQSKALGANVKKGEHGVQIEYWMRDAKEKVRDTAGKLVKDAAGKQVYRTVQLERPRVMHFKVFNAEQIDGLPPPEPKEPAPEWKRHELAEAILKNSGARIQNVNGDQAFYAPAHDTITLPNREQFATADRYYATALHELGHWTGHPSRLDRDLSGGFGSELYAKEELRAEISSLMVGDRLGIGHDPGQHAAYVGSWIKALEDDPREIFRAAADAERISDYVMQFDHELRHEQQHDQVPIKEHEPTPEESARWHRDEWRIEPSLHASAIPELGIEAGQLRQEADAREEAEAVAEPPAEHHAEPDDSYEEDDGMEM